MYTLRSIDDNQGVSNHSLGDFYSKVDRLNNPERFSELFKNVFNEKSDYEKKSVPSTTDEIVTAFIISNNDYIIPIYSSHSNYIMTESGKTFERINLSRNVS